MSFTVVAAWALDAGPGPWAMWEIMAQAFDLTPKSKKYAGIVCKVGPALRRCGMSSRKGRHNGKPPHTLWERVA